MAVAGAEERRARGPGRVSAVARLAAARPGVVSSLESVVDTSP
jgi:hypothetical protein